MHLPTRQLSPVLLHTRRDVSAIVLYEPTSAKGQYFFRLKYFHLCSCIHKEKLQPWSSTYTKRSFSLGLLHTQIEASDIVFCVHKEKLQTLSSAYTKKSFSPCLLHTQREAPAIVFRTQLITAQAETSQHVLHAGLAILHTITSTRDAETNECVCL